MWAIYKIWQPRVKAPTKTNRMGMCMKECGPKTYSMARERSIIRQVIRLLTANSCMAASLVWANILLVTAAYMKVISTTAIVMVRANWLSALNNTTLDNGNWVRFRARESTTILMVMCTMDSLRMASKVVEVDMSFLLGSSMMASGLMERCMAPGWLRRVMMRLRASGWRGKKLLDDFKVFLLIVLSFYVITVLSFSVINKFKYFYY